jgi:hypothetical protein
MQRRRRGGLKGRGWHACRWEGGCVWGQEAAPGHAFCERHEWIRKREMERSGYLQRVPRGRFERVVGEGDG